MVLRGRDSRVPLPKGHARNVNRAPGESVTVLLVNDGVEERQSLWVGGSKDVLADDVAALEWSGLLAPGRRSDVDLKVAGPDPLRQKVTDGTLIDAVRRTGLHSIHVQTGMGPGLHKLALCSHVEEHGHGIPGNDVVLRVKNEESSGDMHAMGDSDRGDSRNTVPVDVNLDNGEDVASDVVGNDSSGEDRDIRASCCVEVPGSKLIEDGVRGPSCGTRACLDRLDKRPRVDAPDVDVLAVLAVNGDILCA